MEIKGISGKISITHWHIGDNVRVSFYNEQDNSVYFVFTNNIGQLVTVLEKGFGQLQIGRATVKLSTLDSKTQIECGDIMNSRSSVICWFNKNQIDEIIVNLSK